jgi:2-oxoglutarate dehydrogenase complex dehydrogenase (E1) component-like enzyme
MKDFSYITSSHPAFIENLYQGFLQDPNSVDPDLKKFFEGFSQLGLPHRAHRLYHNNSILSILF